jgi:hypothetical protein
MLLALRMSCEMLCRCWRNTYFLWVDQCPDELGIVEHVLRPLLTVVIALECLKVRPGLKELFKHNVSSTFEGAAPFAETLRDLVASSVGASSQRKTPRTRVKIASPVITVQGTLGYMLSQMVCRTGIATLSGISQGLACIPTHRSYVGMKTPRNRLLFSAPNGSAEVPLRAFLYAVGAADKVESTLSLRFKGSTWAQQHHVRVTGSDNNKSTKNLQCQSLDLGCGGWISRPHWHCQGLLADRQ